MFLPKAPVLIQPLDYCLNGPGFVDEPIAQRRLKTFQQQGKILVTALPFYIGGIQQQFGIVAVFPQLIDQRIDFADQTAAFCARRREKF